MRQTMLEVGRPAAESRTAQAMIAGAALATMIVGGANVASHSSETTLSSVTEAHEYGPLPFDVGVIMAEHKAELIHMLQRQVKLEQMRRSVPPSVYTAALTRTNGNVVHANQKLAAEHVPPMDPAQAATLTRRLHFRFNAHDKQAVAYQATSWAINTPDNQLKVITNPEAITGDLLTELSAPQEAALREKIVDTARSYVGVHEVGSSNSGPEVDKFTVGHHEEWCADWYTFVYNQAGLPFTGGDTLRRPDWQIPRVLINPRSPQIMSLEAWFKQHGDYFTAKDHLPKPGDAVLQDRPGVGGHVMMVTKVLSNRKLKLVAGNTGNAVREKVISADDPTILGFGSVIKR